VANEFTYHDEVLASLLTDDETARRLVLLVKDYAFPNDQQAAVADALLKFAEQWNVAAKEHAYQLVDEEHRPYVRKLQELSKGVHRDYVMSRLEQFLREGAIRKNVWATLDAVNMGDYDAAEANITGYVRQQSILFNAGTLLKGDALRSTMEDDANEEVFRTGVAALDRAHVGPAPKTMLVFVAPAKRGKSWAMSHMAKTNLADRKTVLHVTLEMSERKVARRYVQSVLSLTKREVEDGIPISTLEVDNLGRFHGIGADRVRRPKLSVDLYERANRIFSRYRLWIKEFPTGSLTVADLKAFLDTMEKTQHVVPDVLIVDYADIMKLSADNLRLETSMLYRDLRGVASERGIALITASQSSRKSADARWVRDTDINEDYSKIHTADAVLTYSQTPEERRLGLARLFVSNARDEGDKWGCLMSQSYAMGQFCLDSLRLDNDDSYWRIVDGQPQPEGDAQ